jgi:hypothetical protein
MSHDVKTIDKDSARRILVKKMRHTVMVWKGAASQEEQFTKDSLIAISKFENKEPLTGLDKGCLSAIVWMLEGGGQ